MMSGMLGFGMGWIGIVMMILFWGSLIFGTMWIVKNIFQNKYQTSPLNILELPALDILNQRYARGEITKEEYQQIKKDLE